MYVDIEWAMYAPILLSIHIGVYESYELIIGQFYRHSHIQW